MICKNVKSLLTNFGFKSDRFDSIKCEMEVGTTNQICCVCDGQDFLDRYPKLSYSLN